MTLSIVIDSGVLIASVIEEDYSKQADALLMWSDAQEVQCFAPTLFHYKVAATLRKLAQRSVINPVDGTRLLKQMLSKLINLMVDDELIQRAYTLATEHGLPSAYDAQYLAVAERLACSLWTVDRRLFNTVHEKLTWVHHLENFAPPSV
jgi:predicted nucleic acid-binding protein